MQNQLFVCDFNAAVSYWKFILAKFIPVVVPVPIVKIFPFGKIKQFFPSGKLNNFPRISIANNLRALRVDNIII